MSHRRAAIWTIIGAVLAALTGGACFSAAEHVSLAHGLYWAVTTATTVGYGDITPRTVAGHWVAVLVMVTAIPLYSATFALFISELSAGHVRKLKVELKEHLASELDKHHVRLLEHFRSPTPGQ